MTVPDVTLNNGVTIPQLGFGVYQVKPDETVQAVTEAFKVGYRHIDTAQMYRNEKQVGQALAQSDLAPSDVFITSKLNNGYHAHDDALRAFDQTLVALGLERIDLFLIHWPLPGVGDFVETWRALEKIYADGRARAIGVSNFHPHHLRRLHEETEITPAVNQIEAHPYFVQQELLDFDAEHGIATEAWSPIAQGLVLDDPVLKGIARDHGKSTAQVVLRWHIQLGSIVFPKSVTAARVQENFEIFDFELTPAEVGFITALDRGQRIGPNPDEFNWIPNN